MCKLCMCMCMCMCVYRTQKHFRCSLYAPQPPGVPNPSRPSSCGARRRPPGRLMTGWPNEAERGHAGRSTRAPRPRSHPPRKRPRRRPPIVPVRRCPPRCRTPRASTSPRGSQDAPARRPMEMALARHRRCSYCLSLPLKRALSLIRTFSHFSLPYPPLQPLSPLFCVNSKHIYVALSFWARWGGGGSEMKTKELAHGVGK